MHAACKPTTILYPMDDRVIVIIRLEIYDEEVEEDVSLSKCKNTSV